MVGRTVSHYSVLRVLGQGGMGVVYEAVDVRLGRHVALKVVSEDAQQEPHLIERLRAEARAASSLNHPNICTVYEIDEEDGRPFLVLELLEGTSLDRLLRAGPCSLDRIIDISLQAASALEAAHSRGLVHRDIKPANLFLTDKNVLKVLDFGLAKAPEATAADLVTTSANLTRPGHTLGTIAYMSPEQASGETVDARSDLFSFGVVLYEMLSGTLPFKGSNSATTLYSLLGSDPKPLIEIIPGLPSSIAEIAEKLLEKDPELRYQSASELRADLRRFIREREGGHSRSGSIPPVPPLAAKRRRFYRWLLAIIGVALLLPGAFWIARRYFARKSVAPFAGYEIAEVTRSGDVTAVAMSPDGRYLLHVKQNSGQQSLWLRNVPTGADAQVIPASTARYSALKFSPDGNYIYFVRDSGPGIGDLYRAPVLGGPVQKLIQDVESNIAFSPDGSRIAFVRTHSAKSGEAASYDLVVAGAADGAGTKILGASSGAMFQSVSWSPDGSKLAAPAQEPNSSLAELMLVNAESPSETRLFGSDRISIAEALWMPDNKGLIVSYKDKETGFVKFQIGYVSYPAGTFQPITRDTNSYTSLSLAADGKILAAVQQQGGYDLTTAAFSGDKVSEMRVAAPHESSKFVSWTSDGELLVDESSGIVRVQGDGSNRTVLPGTDRHKFVTGAFMCAQKYVVFTAVDANASHSNIWRTNADGSDPVRLSSGSDDMAQFCSPDGAWVYYLDEAQTRMARVPIVGGSPGIARRPEGEHDSQPVAQRGVLFAVCVREWARADRDRKIGERSAGTVPRSAAECYVGGACPCASRRMAEAWLTRSVRTVWTTSMSKCSMDPAGRLITDFHNEQIRDFAFSNDGNR